MKQKLIDANKYLEKVCTYKETGCGSCKLQTMCPTDEPVVEAIPIKDIKDFLRCEKIDSCDWRNCSECSQMKCISIRNLNDLIEWSKEKENES